ncbi:hypothetical protein GGR51DRAFT_513021 [Nemania sp. FL0031]|nr:hypothetical protein GGR51DRAFT_513021 [Nemania sp. FL0031]
MTPPAKKRFICTDCPAEFSRKDHAKRHKLSHQRPEFACPHPGCGLFFHRRDVLRRHEAVHKPENDEKRRRPRRGPMPPALPRFEGPGQQQESLSASESHDAEPVLVIESGSVGGHSHSSTSNCPNGDDWRENIDENDVENDVGLECLCHIQNGTVCLSCSSELIRLAEGRIPSESQGAIKFCMTHYIQSQLKWFPFIRSSSLRTNWLLSGRALILAALGARGIKEYKSLAEELWVEAVRRAEAWASSSASGSDILYNFQTKILLVEYLQWSEDNRHPAWVRPMLDEMVHREVHDLAGMVRDELPEFLEDELCQEEIRWTLWRFYCTMTQTSLLGIKLHPPSLFQALDLPGDPKRILALSQAAGRETGGLAVTVRSEFHDRRLTLPQVLSALLADDDRRTELPDILSMTGKYIVLHAILYLSDNMVEEPIDIEAAQREPLGWQVETRERLYRLVVRWRQCFWIPPEVLWSTSFPEFGSLQSVVFIIYLAVRVSEPTRGLADSEAARLSRQLYTRFAMRCIVAMHVSMKNSGLLEVAAKGRWFFDGPSWRAGGLTAKYAMEWFRDRARFGCEDEDVDFLQSLESVMAFYSFTGSYNGVSYSSARLAQLQWSVKHLWTMVLGTESWLDSRFEDPCSTDDLQAAA